MSLTYHYLHYLLFIISNILCKRLEEGNLPQPRCPLCDMMVLWRAFNGMHRRTAQCKQGAMLKRRRLTAEGGEGGDRQGFQNLWAPPGDDDLLQIFVTVDLSIRQRISGCGKELILGEGDMEEDDTNLQQGGEALQVFGFFFKAVVQLVLIFIL